MENGSVNTLKFVICFHFQVVPLHDVYVMLHNSSVLLTYIMTLYHIQHHKIMIGQDK